MRPTNYYLFDFMDFDTDLKRDESLWKAYKPTAVREKDGDILVSVPFQKQVLDNDMSPDLSVPKEEYTLVIRQYEPKVLRLFIGFGEAEMTDSSEMLQYSPRVRKTPLSVSFANDQWTVTDPQGTVRAVINIQEPRLDRWSSLQPDPQETLDLRLYPDGKGKSAWPPTTTSRPRATTRCPWASARPRGGRTGPRSRSNARPTSASPERASGS